MELGRYCIATFGWHSNLPSLERSVEKFTATVLSVLLMTPLCRQFHCPSCGTSTDRQIDRQTLMLKVIPSSCLLQVVCVPLLTVSRHYTVQSAGYRLRRVGNDISCWLSVFWDLKPCGLVALQLALCRNVQPLALEQNFWYICAEDGSGGFLCDICNYWSNHTASNTRRQQSLEPLCN